jgi:hypothetical protein
MHYSRAEIDVKFLGGYLVANVLTASTTRLDS